jgi:CHRD domain
MRRFGAILSLSAASVLMLSGAGSAQDLDSTGRTHGPQSAERLLGGNENPPVISDGSGRFRARVSNDRIGFTLRYDVASEDSDVSQAHLHIQNPGNNGGIVVFLCSNLGNTPEGATQRECPASPGEVEGDIVAGDVLTVSEGDPPVTIIEAGDLEGLARLIDQGAVYANVHSDDHPAGEIRGQLNPRRR